MRRLKIVGIALFIVSVALLESCSLINDANEQVADAFLGDIEKVEGRWNLISVSYKHEEKIDGVWKTWADTLYPNAAGFLEIVAVNEDDIEGSYDFTFNDTNCVRDFTGDFSALAPTVNSLRFKSGQEHFILDAGIFVDLLITENTETTLQLNRKQLILQTAVTNESRENWYLDFSK